MRITTFTDYSLRALMFVAQVEGGRTTIAEAADALAIPESQLVKVVHTLGRLGILRNTRGRGGGFSLAVPAAQINVGEVMDEIESTVIAECFDDDRNTCGLAGRCRLERVLQEALGAFRDVLGRYTLQDLVIH